MILDVADALDVLEGQGVSVSELMKSAGTRPCNSSWTHAHSPLPSHRVGEEGVAPVSHILLALTPVSFGHATYRGAVCPAFLRSSHGMRLPLKERVQLRFKSKSVVCGAWTTTNGAHTIIIEIVRSSPITYGSGQCAIASTSSHRSRVHHWPPSFPSLHKHSQQRWPMWRGQGRTARAAGWAGGSCAHPYFTAMQGSDVVKRQVMLDDKTLQLEFELLLYGASRPPKKPGMCMCGVI
eukprot:6061040-Pleurochrysis_carterae.AAC.4